MPKPSKYRRPSAEMVQRGLDGAWRTYFAWYAFFITSNMAVMGWLFTRLPEEIPHRRLVVLSSWWAMFNLLGAGATLRMLSFTKLVSRGRTEREIVFPLQAAKFAGIANAVVMIAIGVQWMLLLYEK